MYRILLILIIAWIASSYSSEVTDQAGFLIENVVIIDGTGTERVTGAVRISGALISEIGTLEPLPGEKVIDGQGQVLAPGFIDTHSHVASEIEQEPGALAAVHLPR